jgi:hypothetical protein
MEIRKMEHNVTNKKTVKAWFVIIIGAELWDRWCLRILLVWLKTEAIVNKMEIVNLHYAFKEDVMVIYLIQRNVKCMMIVRARYATKIYVVSAFTVNLLLKLQI